MIGYAGRARAVLGVDPDPAAVERLKAALRQQGLDERFRVTQGDIRSVTARADVAFFEFCLHEIVDPLTALRQARALAPETLILDHAPGFPWAWHLCEAEKVLRGWGAAARFPATLGRTFPGVQRFRDHAELLAKVQVLGEPVIRRIGEFAGRQDFGIDMPYRVPLLSHKQD